MRQTGSSLSRMQRAEGVSDLTVQQTFNAAGNGTSGILITGPLMARRYAARHRAFSMWPHHTLGKPP